MAKVKKKTATIIINPFELRSSWFCDQTGSGKNKKYKFRSGYPSVAKDTKGFMYELPSGSKIKKATITANITTPQTGWSILSANGNTFKSQGKGKYKATITVKSKTVTNVRFSFKANGSKDREEGTSVIQFSNVTLKIEYETSGATPKKPAAASRMAPPPQTVCLYNPSNNRVYMFDGVQRIQHQISTKVDEEPNVEKYSYVNNAVNEPDKVTLDVAMSDVYTGSSALESEPSLKSDQTRAINAGRGYGLTVETSRSANAYSVLKELKESRAYLEVVTPQHVYVEMMITSLVANQDEMCPFGWTGQIVLQSKYAPINPGYNAKKEDAGDARPTESPLWKPPKNEDEKEDTETTTATEVQPVHGYLQSILMPM